MTDLDRQTDVHNAHNWNWLKGWWIRLPDSLLARKWIHLLPNHSDTYLEGVLKQIWSGIQIKDRRSRLQILNQLQFWFQNTSTSDWGWPSARTCSRSPSCKADMATDTFRKWAPGLNRPRARTIRLWLEDLVSLSRVTFAPSIAWRSNFWLYGCVDWQIWAPFNCSRVRIHAGKNEQEDYGSNRD